MTLLRNSEPLTLEGKWSPPDHEEAGKVGTLTFQPEDGAELVVLSLDEEPGDFSADPEPEPVLLGRTVDGRSVTAFDCTARHHSSQLLGGGSRTTYRVGELVVGAHAAGRGDLSFSRARIYVDGLLEWLCTGWHSGVRRRPLLTAGGRESVGVRTDGGQLQFGLVTRRHRTRFRETFERDASVRVVVPTPLTLDEWRRRWIRPLVDLVAFATGTRSEIDALTALMYADQRGQLHATPRSGRRSRHAREIHVLTGRRALPKSRRQSSDFLMPAGVRGYTGFAGLVREWFKEYRALGDSAAVFYGTLSAPNIYLETRLLNLLSFAEAYHRRKFDQSSIPGTRRKQLRRQMLALLTADETEIYQPRIDHAHEQTQRSRVRFLINRAGAAVPELVDVADTLTAQLVATRNYWTHWTGRSAHVVEGPELWRCTSRLLAVLQANLLRDLGLPDASIAHGVCSEWIFHPDVLSC